MGYNLTIRPEADIEISEALLWHEDQQVGLGLSLSREFREVINDIKEYPEHSQKRYRNIHIRFTKRFRYGIHYIIEENSIYVLAVLHTSRKPRK